MQIAVSKDSYTGHARSPWLVVVPRRISPTGKRQYRRFSTRQEAATFAQALRRQVRIGGEQPIAAIPAALAADAQAAAAILEGTGLSLTEAARLLLERGMPESVASALYTPTGGAGATVAPGEGNAAGAAAPLTLNAALAAVEAAKADNKQATKNTRRSTCKALFRRNPGLAEMPLTACTPASMQAALDKAWPRKPQPWNTGRRVLHALFAWAIKRRLVIMENPITPLDLKRVAEVEITALPPDRLRALFAACRPATEAERCAAEGLPPGPRRLLTLDTSNLRAYLAICAFAGIRPAECARLCWDDIDTEESVISVRGSNSKTGGTRHIPIAPALAAWLATARPAAPGAGEPITPQRDLARRLAALRQRAGFGAALPWQNDCLRHSYATYFLKAKIGDLRQLQYNMGHRSSALLYARYTNMKGVTLAAAEAWWQVTPETIDGGAGA